MFFFKQTPKTGLSPQDAIKGLQDGTITVIDVREHGELAKTGKATKALHIPLMRLRDMADPRHPDFHSGLSKDAIIAVYCASGGRSGSAQSILRDLGYDKVHNIGGFGHWIKAGGAVERA